MVRQPCGGFAFYEMAKKTRPRPVMYFYFRQEKREQKIQARVEQKEQEKLNRQAVRELNRLEINRKAALDQIARIGRHRSVSALKSLKRLLSHSDALVRAKAAEQILRIAEGKARFPNIKRITEDVNK